MGINECQDMYLLKSMQNMERPVVKLGLKKKAIHVVIAKSVN